MPMLEQTSREEHSQDQSHDTITSMKGDSRYAASKNDIRAVCATAASVLFSSPEDYIGFSELAFFLLWLDALNRNDHPQYPHDDDAIRKSMNRIINPLVPRALYRVQIYLIYL